MASTINSTNSGSGGLITTGDASNELQIQTGDTTRVTINSSGNVGVGTTSPRSVTNYKSIGINGTTGSILDLFSNGTRVGTLSTDGSGVDLYAVTSVPLRFYTNATERMRIDASGNVGIGTSSPNNSLTVSRNGADVARFVNSGSNGGDWQLKIGGGGFEDRKLMITDRYSGADSVRMAIDSSGNVGIGTSSPTYKLTVNAGASTGAIKLSGDSSFIEFDNSSTKITGGGNLSLQAAGLTDFYTSGANLRMRIDSSGNVMVGTTTPINAAAGRGNITINGSSNAILNFGAGTVQKGYLYHNGTDFTLNNSVSGIIRFDTNDTERMRINSSGQTILGSNTSTVASNVLNIWSPTSTLNGIYMQKSGQCEVQIGFKASTDTNFYIGTGSPTMGTYGVYLSNTGNSWNAVSDERKKNIIEPIENGLEKVNSLRAVIGSYKHDPQSIRRPFLIAQDVQAVLPEAVNVQDEEDGTLGMSYTDTIPLLVAAIKELKAENDALKARLDAAGL